MTLVLMYVATVVFTELVTNNAAAILMFPVAISAASGIGVDPMPFDIATMMAASAEFISPIGYQRKLTVYGPGGYRSIDAVRSGLSRSLVIGTAVITASSIFWPF